MTSLLVLPPRVATDTDPAGVYNPSDRGSDRGSGYWATNAILRHCDRLFATWQGYDPGTGKYTVWVATNQLGTGLWSSAVALPDPQTITGHAMDNHGGASIIADSAGYFHLFYGPHNTPMLEALSDFPWDASSFSRTPTVVPTAPWLDTTYSSVVRDSSGTLHLVYRGRNAGQWRMVYQRGVTSSNGTTTWDTPVVLASTADGTSNTTGYSLYGGPIAVRKRKFLESLHVAYSLYYDSTGAARSWGYLRSNDGGNTWLDWQGADVTSILPIDSSVAKEVHRVETSPMMDVRMCNLTVDPWGNPWVSVIYLAHPGRPVLGGYDTKLWHLTGGQWSTISLSPHVSSLGPTWRVSGATITFDSEGVLYVAADVVDMSNAGLDSWFADKSKEVVVLMSTDMGQTFQMHPISTPDPTRPRWLASIERSTISGMIPIPALQYTDGPDTSNANGQGTDIVFVPLYKY